MGPIHRKVSGAMVRRPPMGNLTGPESYVKGGRCASFVNIRFLSKLRTWGYFMFLTKVIIKGQAGPPVYGKSFKEELTLLYALEREKQNLLKVWIKGISDSFIFNGETNDNNKNYINSSP